MLYIAVVFAAAIVFASASWAEEQPAPGVGAAVTTTTQPERSPYHRRAGDPPNLPTGLPGFGTPGPPPEHEKNAPTNAETH